MQPNPTETQKAFRSISAIPAAVVATLFALVIVRYAVMPQIPAIIEGVKQSLRETRTLNSSELYFVPETTYDRSMYHPSCSDYKKQRRKILVVPPVCEGSRSNSTLEGRAARSLGDEALVQSLVLFLKDLGQSVTLMSWCEGATFRTDNFGIEYLSIREGDHGRPSWIHVVERMEKDPLWPKVISDFDQVFSIGADIMDGFYSKYLAITHIHIVRDFANAGKPAAVVGFSYENTRCSTCTEEILALPPSARLNVRDPRSLHRLFKLAPKERDLNAVADIAFLLEPRRTSLLDPYLAFVDRMHAQDRIVIGLNINLHPTANFSGKQLAETWTRALASTYLDRATEPIAYLFLFHDLRTDQNDLTTNKQAYEALVRRNVSREHVMVVQHRSIGAAEVKYLCSKLDMVLTGRMHLAIASLSSGVPTIPIAAKEKMLGLMELWDIPSFTITTDALAAPDTLARELRWFVTSRDRARRHNRKMILAIQRLALANVCTASSDRFS